MASTEKISSSRKALVLALDVNPPKRIAQHPRLNDLLCHLSHHAEGLAVTCHA
jgi:hypothetical protein